jgi:glutamate transport system substrate-binding protein
MARLAESGELHVGITLDQPLWSLPDVQGAPAGFDVEIAEIVAAGLGIPGEDVEWQVIDPEEREDVLVDGDVDIVVATYAMTDERRERVGFAGPYTTVGQDLLVRDDEERITGPESLRDPALQVCAMEGQPPAAEIPRYSARVVLRDIYSTCVDLLGVELVDAVTAEAPVLVGFALGYPGVRMLGTRFTTQDYGIGIPRGDVGFCEFLNDTLAAAAADGRYADAWARTAGQYDPYTPTLPPPAPCV